MKKVFLLILTIILSGCSLKQSQESKEFDFYNKIKDQLILNEEFDSVSNDFNIQVLYQKRTNDYRYDVVIDKPQALMTSIVALCYSDEKDDRLCPSIGIFDDKMNLKKDYINKEEKYYKGIQLSGTCRNIEPIRVYLQYFNEDNQKIIKYLEVSGREVR